MALSTRIMWLSLLMALSVVPVNAQVKNLGQLIVYAGDFERSNALVSVSLEGVEFDQANRQLTIYELKGKNRIPINSHIEQGYQAKLWWVLSGITGKGSKRVFEMNLVPRDTVPEIPLVKVERTTDHLLIRIKDKNVLQYQVTPLPAPEGVPQLYQRSGFIHPLWSPKGEVLTRVQPPDHYHHVGIWNPWTHTEYEGREIDFWNLIKAQGTVVNKKVVLRESSHVMGRFKAIHEHIDLTAPEPMGSKVALNEEWEVRVWNVDPESNIWLVDIISSMNCSDESPLRIKEYRYQGFGYRATEKWDDNTATLLTSAGKNKSDGNSTRARWCDVNGVSEFGTSGILFMTHPSNYNYPEPLRIWPTGANGGKGNVFFNINPTQDRDWVLLPGRTYALKYRMLVYDGKLSREQAEQAWNDFANPTKVELHINID